MKNTNDRRTVYIDKWDWGHLRNIAGRLSQEENQQVSVAELVRRAVKLFISHDDG